MKNLLKLALMASLFTVGVNTAHADSKQDGSEAVMRFEGVKKVFEDKGIAAITFLNGVGTMGSATGKGRTSDEMTLEAGIDNFNDPDAALICIGKDDNYIVHTAQTFLVGKSAVSGKHIWRDGAGVPIVGEARKALSRGTPDGLTTIDFVRDSRIKNPRTGAAMADNDWLAVADNRYIKGLPEGSFCATNVELFTVRDNSDIDREHVKDRGAGKIGHDVPAKNKAK